VQPLALLERFVARWPRIRLVSAAALCALALSLLAPATPAPSLDALAASLGAAVGGKVMPADVRWEASDGSLGDYLFGRKVLFLASETPSGPRDLYRAHARLAPEGRVVELFAPRNLTGTPLGDDHSLVVLGDHAAFATFVYGQEQTVTWLDLGGERAAPAGPDDSLADRVTDCVTRYEDTGSLAGIARVEVSLVPPARAIGLALGPRDLSIELVDDTGKRATATLDGERAELEHAPGEMHADLVRRFPKRFVLWAVDTVRAWVGPAPIAWLEEHVFAARDTLRRAVFQVRGGGAETADVLAEPQAQPAPAAALDASQAGGDGVAWPPQTVPSIWKTKEPGEGEWQEPRLAWTSKRDAAPVGHDGPPPAFYRTFVRPDPDRPYSRVILVAMDMRQLDLAMEAGTEDPKPLTGGHGPGRIPRDPAVASRVVAAFNGGFKTEHGSYGMMVNRRILLPPQPSAATVVVLKDQRVGFGTWADTHEVTGVQGVRAEDIVSFRQNLDPLVDNGEVNPMGRALWGYTLPGSGMQTERSGICVTDTGQMLYAWGDDVSGTALGKALKAAGCTYAMHLDMNPHHTGFIFSKITELRGHNYRSELLTPLMTVSPDRYIEYAPKDFFYVLLHDSTPNPVAGTTFHPDPGAQPHPVWAPAIWSSRLDSRDGPVDLTLIEAGRARFRIRAGLKEPDAKTGASPLYELDADDAHRVVLALGLGHAQDKRPRGLATDGRLSYPMHGMDAAGDADGGYAELVADADGRLSIARPRDVTSIGAHVDLAELPLLLDDGNVAADARRASTPMPRGALGVTSEGRVFIARGTFASDAPLVDALVRAGCSRAVGLDRGARTPPFLARVGTSTPPRGRSDETALYALSAPMKPRGFRFEPVAAVAQAGRTK
jgi:hypothetical protein